MSLGHGEVWIGVLVQCYMECNTKEENNKHEHVYKGTINITQKLSSQ